MKTKACSTCGKEKDADLFVKNTNQCKVCKSEYMKEYARKNASSIKEMKHKAYEDNKEDILENRKEYYENNKTHILSNVKLYRTLNSEVIKEQKTQYYEINKEDIKRKNNVYDRERRKIDVIFRLRKDTSKHINAALKRSGSSKLGGTVMDFLPYTILQLRCHLESQFEPWMNWENQGVYEKNSYVENDPTTWTWHIDHIIPQSKLPYSSMVDENFQRCWSLDNLRPLKSIDNIKKGSKVIP